MFARIIRWLRERKFRRALSKHNFTPPIKTREQLLEEIDRLTIKTQRCYDGESANSGITFDLSDLQEKGSGTST